MQSSVDKFSPYLKAFATGPKGNRDLSFDEAKEATAMLLSQEVPPELIGALLMTWRVKGESVEEMLGALSALKEGSEPLTPRPDSIEIALPMEGKKKNIPLLILAAKLLEDTHFCVTASPAFQNSHPLSLLNLKEHLPQNVHLISRENYLPKLEALHTLRSNLKMRSVFNTLEKLHHPLQSRYAVIGAHHGPYFKKYAELFTPQYERLAVVQGDEGSGEIIQKSKIHIIEKGELIEELLINPKDFDIDFEKPSENLSQNRAIEQILNPSPPLQKLARLNAAIYCYTIDPKSSIEHYYSNL